MKMPLRVWAPIMAKVLMFLARNVASFAKSLREIENDPGQHSGIYSARLSCNFASKYLAESADELNRVGKGVGQ